MLFRAALVLAAVASQQSAPLVLSGGEVLFVAHGNLGMRVEGRTRDLAMSTAPDAVEFQVRLDTLDTGIALRDRHMREDYLEVRSYPLAQLRIPRDNLPALGGVASGTCRGELTLHGKTHPVDVSFRMKPSSGYEVMASVQVDMRDYGIAAPKYLGISIKPLVEVSVDFHLASR